MNQWYYARGGQQHGPVSEAEIHALIRNGGLDPAKDLVWTQTMTDWLPAAQVPELRPTAPTPAADPANPYAAPPSMWNEPPPTTELTTIEEIEPGSDPIEVGTCIRRGFDLTVRHFGMILLVMIVYFAITVAVAYGLAALDAAMGWGQPVQQEWETTSDSMSYFYETQGSVPNLIISNLISTFLSLGAIRIGLNLVSGESITIGLLFSQGRKLLTAVVASVLYGAMVIVGLVLLIVPGVYLALRFGQYMNAIVDRDLGILQSLSYSSSITTNNRLNLFLLVLIAIAIAIAGCLALIIGLIFAYPVIWVTWMVAYRWMQYGRRVALDHPGTAQPMLKGIVG